MSENTKDQLLETAANLFAERGFYGVSIAQIAGELGLTKQALLHHFATKEKLYAEVLKSISTRFDEKFAKTVKQTENPAEQYKDFLLSLLPTSKADVTRTRLLMRELLDNSPRANQTESWFLKPFLDRLFIMLRSVPSLKRLNDSEILALNYQLLGAMNYFVVSEPTLRGIYGDERYRGMEDTFARQYGALIDIAVLNRE